MGCNRAWLWVLLVGAALAHAADAPLRVTATDAWIRWLPGDLPAGGYLTLRNDGETAQALVSASSDAFAVVTLHQSRINAGVSSMQPVQRIALSPHQSLSFAASGYHIMLERAVRPLHPGDRVPITLHWQNGSTLTVPFEVRPPDAG